MAKTTTKPSLKKDSKSATSKTNTKALSIDGAATDSLDKASEDALRKLEDLGIEQQLQEDLKWCLGSYRFDKNPTGLYEVVGRALTVLQAEKSKKTKGVTIKLIGDLEKALKIQ